MEYTFITIGIIAVCLLVYLFSKDFAKFNETEMPYNSGKTNAMYFPKWKKLKYWQPTKKNPKRR